MKIFAIADLHLSGAGDKPMSVFGEQWQDHEAKLFSRWNDTVGEEDLVLVPGDICWAMHLSDAAVDLARIAALKGTKVLLKGNHDYWWCSVTKLREQLPKSMHCVQNDSVTIGDVCVCGSRGWTFPTLPNFSPETDLKIYKRELVRLELSLKSVDRSRAVVAMIHFPPMTVQKEKSGFSELFEAYDIPRVAYGHLHSHSCKLGFNGEHNSVCYHLCSADYLELTPKQIFEV